jgi:hypothetical protein
MACIQRLLRYVKTELSGLFIAYLIFAGYIIFDAFTIALNPESGRVSSFNCAGDSRGNTICTITIYGIREIVQQDFLVDKSSSTNVFSVGYHTDGQTCGIQIRTGNYQKINFVYPNQDCGDQNLAQTAGRINRVLLEIPHPPSMVIFYNGYNRGLLGFLFRRIILLVVGLCAVLLYSSLKRFVEGHKLTFPVLIKNKFFSNVLTWWGINALVRVFFFTYLWLMLLYAMWLFQVGPVWKANLEGAGFFNSCLVLEKRHGISAGLLFSLYPFIAFAILQAFVQWRYLKRKISLSAWWIATPILSMTPLVILLGSFMSIADYDCLAFKFILSGAYFLPGQLDGFIGKHSLFLLLSYFLLLGFVQRYLLNARLKSTWIWIIVPLANAIMLFVTGNMYYLLREVHINLDSMLFTSLPLMLFLSALLLIQDIVSAVFLARIFYANSIGTQEVALTTLP